MNIHKKLKLSKSEYVILINLVASILSFAVYLKGDYYHADGDNSFLYSDMIISYTCLATIWFSIFVPFNGEVFEKRWLTKKEKDYSYLVYALVSLGSFLVKILTVEVEYKTKIWLSLIPFAIVSVLWLILRAGGPYTDEQELYNTNFETVCENLFYYESDEKTLQIFGVGTTWYDQKRYRRLCKTYVKTAKEFSGKCSVWEIELRVRNRLMIANSRFSSIATLIALSAYGIYFLALPFYDPSFILAIGMPCQTIGVFTVVRNLHDPLTPNEADELERRGKSYD